MIKITVQMIKVNGNTKCEEDTLTTSFINITRINVVVDEKDCDLLSHEQRYYVEMLLKATK
jgi:hypothetical protein